MQLFGKEVLPIGIGMARFTQDVPKSLRGINHAIDRGIRVFETAERFGDWQAEDMIGDVFAPHQSALFLIGKCHPSRHTQLIKSCEDSLRKLSIDKFDLYLLHFDARHVDYQQLRDGFETLVHRGLIDHYGIGSIDLNRLLGLNQNLDARFAANQMLYSPATRNAENGSIKRHADAGIELMSYSIFVNTFRDQRFLDYCHSVGINPGTMALRWVQRQRSVFPLVTAYDVRHIDHLLDDVIDLDQHLRMIDQIFPNQGITELQTD